MYPAGRKHFVCLYTGLWNCCSVRATKVELRLVLVIAVKPCEC